MAVPKLRLDYVNNSGNWTQAKTPENNDAVLLANVQQAINAGAKAEVIVANRTTKANADNANDGKGNLTDIFTSFQRVRLVDQETGIVVFAGRIYRVRTKWDLQYGQTIILNAFDAFKELEEFSMADAPSTVKSMDTTSSNVSGYDLRKRSQVIKYILNQLDLNDNLSVSDTDHFDDSWSTDSLGDKKFNPTKISRSVLKIMQELAMVDPIKNASGTAIGESGYDFRVDPYFTSCAADHKPAAQLNYFQRGTRPGRGGAYNNEASPTLCTTSTDSLTIEYPVDGWNGDSGLAMSMSQQFEFDRPKEELYTELILEYEDQSREDENANSEGTSGSRGVMSFELLKGTASGTFTWSGKALDPSKNTTNITEELTISGTVMARAQWQSGSTSGYLLVSNVSSSFPTSGNVTLTGATSGATFAMNAATGRMVTKYGLKRPIKIARNLNTDLNVLREEVVSRLIGRTDLEIIRGKFSTNKKYPFVYYDLPGNSSRSTATISWSGTVDAQARGIRKGHVIAEVDSVGTYVRYAYISAVNSATSVTYGASATDTSDGTALNASNTMRLIVPIRPGDVVRVKNTINNIDTDQLILEMTFDESPGMRACNYTTVGSNGKFSNVFDNPIAIANMFANAENKEFSPAESNQSFVFSGTINRGASTPGSNDYRTIHWTAGTFSTGDGSKYTIAAANSPTLTTAKHIIYFRPTSAEASANTSDTAFQVQLVSSYKEDPKDVQVGWCYASANQQGAKAVLILAPQIQSEDLFAAGSSASLTAVLFSKSAQAFESTLELVPPSTQHYGQLDWAAATIKFQDGDEWNIVAKGSNHYSATSNGTSYSTEQQLHDTGGSPAARVWYVFIDTADASEGGNLVLRWTLDYNHIPMAGSTPKSTRVFLAQVAVDVDNTNGNAPRVFPFTTKSLVVNAASIAADAITTTHLTANAIDAHTITLTGVNNVKGKIITSAGAVRDISSANLHYLSTNFTSGSGVLIDEVGILGASGTGIDNTEFYLASSDGKAYFAKGRVSMDKTGLWIDNSTIGGSTPSTGFIVFKDDGGNCAIYKANNGGMKYGSGAALGNSNHPTSHNLITTGSTAYISASTNTYKTTLGKDKASDGVAWEGFRALYLSLSDTGGSVPGDPVGRKSGLIYVKDDGHLYYKGRADGSSDSDKIAEVSLSSGGGGGSGENNENSFKYIEVSGQTTVTADTDTDTLTLVAGSNMTITTSGDTITFASTGGSVSAGNGISVSGSQVSINYGYGGTWTQVQTFAAYTENTTSSTTGPSFFASGAPARLDKGLWFKDEVENNTNIPAPDSGFIRLFSEGEYLKYKRSGGTVATIPALSYNMTWTGTNTHTGQIRLSNGSYASSTYTPSLAFANALTTGWRMYTSNNTINVQHMVGNALICTATADAGTGGTTLGANRQLNWYAQQDFNNAVLYDVFAFRAGNSGGAHDSNSFSWDGKNGYGMYLGNGTGNGSAGSLGLNNHIYISVNSSEVIEFDETNTKMHNHLNMNDKDIWNIDDMGFKTLPVTGGDWYLSIEAEDDQAEDNFWVTKYLPSSTRRFKNDIRDVEIDTSNIYKLKAKTFVWKDHSEVRRGLRGTTDFGFIAEEVHEVLPELIRMEPDDASVPRSVNYEYLSVLLLEEMKKLKARIEILEGN